MIRNTDAKHLAASYILRATKDSQRADKIVGTWDQVSETLGHDHAGEDDDAAT